MGFVIDERPDGLSVVYGRSDWRSVRTALKRLDPNLTLTREYDHAYRAVVWTVNYTVGGSELYSFQWRDPPGSGTGPPLPLSHALVEYVKRQEGRGPELLREARERNRMQQETVKRDHDQQMDELAKDHARTASEVFSACFPRGQWLRAARGRERARGRNV
jgi:hypothetical protein